MTPPAQRRIATARKPATARRTAVTRPGTPIKPAPTPVEPEPVPEPETDTESQPPRVLVNGIPYEPAASPDSSRVHSFPRAGLAVTTHNRNELLDRCLAAWRRLTPQDWPILVVDDASEKPVDGADYRFDTQQGVPVAKNKALELLMRTGVEHLFLLDDDILPRAEGWWRPYLESPEPHLAHSWNLQKVGGDDLHVAWHASGGPMLYYRRDVIADVGGMRTDFGQEGKPSWGCEHVNLSDRIFNRGWTTWRYADVVGADKLFTELDRDPRHKSTSTAAQRQHNAGPGRELWRSRIHTDTAFVEYRTDSDAVLTCLFTGGTAKQTNRRYRPSTSLITELAASVRHGRMVCFHDELDSPQLRSGSGPVEFVRDSCTINVFFQRWQTYWRWLREHPEVARVWCVDGTDVRQLRDPFTALQPGRLHIGWEPTVLGTEWFGQRNQPETQARAFLDAHPGLQVLNPGLLGGDRATVMEFCHAMMAYLHDLEIAASQGWQARATATVAGGGDMGAANLVAYSRFADRLVTGTQVATLFKHDEGDNGCSWWSHK